MGGGPLLVAALTALAVMIFFLAFWRLVRTAADPVEERLAQYGMTAELVGDNPAAEGRPRPSRLGNLLSGFGQGRGLSEKLSRADIAMTASEFGLMVLGAAGAGFLLGAWRVGLLFGVVIGAALGYAPFLYLTAKTRKRENTFTQQLPEVLDLLVGSLRAGYGLSQALGTLVDQLPPPASDEFRRVQRAVELGVPMQRALNDLTERITTQDVNLVVTAINVQHEMGGNLAETLDTIGYTVRDRLRMLREIRTLTAQQRLTGYILAGVPIFLAVTLNFMNPEYMAPLFQPGMWRILPVISLIMEGIGFMIIKKIVDIEV